MIIKTKDNLIQIGKTNKKRNINFQNIVAVAQHANVAATTDIPALAEETAIVGADNTMAVEAAAETLINTSQTELIRVF